MPDGKHDLVDFREEQSASLGDRQNINELLARLDSLEKELGHFIRETNSKGTTRAGGGE